MPINFLERPDIAPDDVPPFDSLPMDAEITVRFAEHKLSPIQYTSLTVGGVSMTVTVKAGESVTRAYQDCYEVLRQQVQATAERDVSDFWMLYFAAQTVPPEARPPKPELGLPPRPNQIDQVMQGIPGTGTTAEWVAPEETYPPPSAPTVTMYTPKGVAVEVPNPERPRLNLPKT